VIKDTKTNHNNQRLDDQEYPEPNHHLSRLRAANINRVIAMAHINTIINVSMISIIVS